MTHEMLVCCFCVKIELILPQVIVLDTIPLWMNKTHMCLLRMYIRPGGFKYVYMYMYVTPRGMLVV